MPIFAANRLGRGAERESAILGEKLVGIVSQFLCRLWRSVKIRSAGGAVAVLVFCNLLGAAGHAGQETQPLDPTRATEIQPYALMSGDAYDDAKGQPANIPGWSRIDNWEGVFSDSKSGLGGFKNDAKSSGFYASIWRNDQTGELVIAYRGTDSLSAWNTDREAACVGSKCDPRSAPAQYQYAAKLAAAVRTVYPDARSISTTGHSLGGALATYAAQQTAGINRVTTFNPHSSPFLSSSTAGWRRSDGTIQVPKQINIVVPGNITDAKDSVRGIGPLPGQTYSVKSDPTYGHDKHYQDVFIDQSPASPRYRNSLHSIQGVIGGLCAVSPSSCPARQMASASPSQGGTAYPRTGVQPPAAATPQTPSAVAPPSVGAASPPTVPPRDRIAAYPSPSGVPATLGVPRAPGAPSTPGASSTPGGISLSKAAASRMALNITLEGAYYKDGRLVLSGRETSEQTLDSALLLTALRAACETGDPYFSLDPDSGAWLEEGEKAFATLWERVKADVGWERRVKADQRTVRSHSLLVRNIWARRDYPQLWSAIASEYPHLRSQLVFRPLWLQQTRFGEILYKADVLLKELASGTSVLEPGPLRAAGVDGYVSQLGRENANSLFASVHGQKIEKKWKASRLWFDIAPRTPTAGGGFDAQTIRSGADRELFATLKEHGLVPGDRPYSPPVLQLVKDGDALDLTKVFPTMFVRRHDFVRGVDLPDDDVVMNAFASDVNDSIEKYVSRYKELQALTEVVRAYVAAVHVANNNESICRRLSGFELLESEKMDRPLPAFHPSELNVMVARYAAGDGRRAVRTMFVSATTVQGGVTIAGKSFYSTGPVVAAATALTRSLKAETAQPAQSTAWKGAEGRQFIAFALDNDEQIGIQTVISVSPPGEVPDVPGAEITPDIEIENEPAAAIPPAH